MKIFRGILIIGLFLFFACSSAARAATYYIDYAGGSDSNNGISRHSAWKHHPYMVGWSGSYRHRAGDKFIFKGGVVWKYSSSDHIFPWTIKAGGAHGNPDRYTVDKTWHNGPSWTPPVFDGGQQTEGGHQTLGANSWLIGDGQNPVSNIVIDGLRFQNIGNPARHEGSGTAIYFLGSGSSIEIENCVIIPHSMQAFAYANYAHRKNARAIYIHDNRISYSGRGVIYGYTGYTVDDVKVYNNKWQGPGLKLAEDFYTGPSKYHNDGLMTGCPAGCSGKRPAVTNILFNNNLFYGAWEYCTGQYYSNGYTSNTSIYNNVFSIENNSSNGTPMQNFIEFYKNDWGTINIYNNTFSSDSLIGYGTGVNEGFHFVYPSNAAHPLTINIENNIFSGLPIGIVIGSGAWNAMNIDHNLYNITTLGRYGYVDYIAPKNYSSISAACGGGYDCNSLMSGSYSSSYPGFISKPAGRAGIGNWQLQSGSPAIGAGVNLSSVFNTDITGATRPSAGAWTIGAYEGKRTGKK